MAARLPRLDRRRSTRRAVAVSRLQGPPVWLGMDPKELDDAYTQSVYAPNMRQVLARYAANSDATRARLGAPRRLSYGPEAIERADLYPTEGPRAPVQMFVHGGAWREGSASRYAFLAECFVRAGAHWLVPDFSWVQDVGASLSPIVAQLRRAVAWTYRNAESFGGDPDRLYLSGHSSGGHLAGVLLTTDWAALGLPGDVLKGGLCVSGMFDLTPVRLSARGSYVDFTDETVEALSPARHLDALRAPLLVAYGTLETPEFQRRSRDFAAAVRAAGKSVELLEAEGYNHFEVLETLANPYGILGRAALAQMGLGRS